MYMEEFDKDNVILIQYNLHAEVDDSDEIVNDRNFVLLKSASMAKLCKCVSRRRQQ